MKAIQLKGIGGEINLEVSGYENIAASNISDANWLTTKVILTVGNFSGVYSANLTTHDFLYFTEKLKNLVIGLKGQADFITDEEAIGFSIAFDARGRVFITGKAKNIDFPKVELSFQFESDQTYLTKTLDDFEQCTNHFPVRNILVD